MEFRPAMAGLVAGLLPREPGLPSAGANSAKTALWGKGHSSGNTV